MQRRLLSAVSAAALAIAPVACAPAFAQSSQTVDSVETGLQELGVETSVGELTPEQTLEIEAVLTGDDADQTKVQRIERIVSMDGTDAPGRLGVQQLHDSVTAELAELGIEDPGTDMLSLSELAQVETVLNSTDPDDLKRERIQGILAAPGDGTTTDWGVARLEDSVQAKMVELGLDGSQVSALTLSELAQIENVANSDDPNDIQRDRIEEILMQ